MGYDLLNEPIPHFEGYEKFNPLLEPLYKRIVAAIRAVDSHHLIFLGGAQWNTNFKVFGPPFDRQLVYNFHKYWMEPVQQQIQSTLIFGKNTTSALDERIRREHRRMDRGLPATIGEK
jgi:aryl-phospho-beta-D-glucosidase BglC (GH1 family)